MSKFLNLIPSLEKEVSNLHLSITNKKGLPNISDYEKKDNNNDKNTNIISHTHITTTSNNNTDNQDTGENAALNLGNDENLNRIIVL